jgi:hypothetical protein
MHELINCELKKMFRCAETVVANRGARTLCAVMH